MLRTSIPVSIGVEECDSDGLRKSFTPMDFDTHLRTSGFQKTGTGKSVTLIDSARTLKRRGNSRCPPANIRFPDPPFLTIRWREGVWVRKTAKRSTSKTLKRWRQLRCPTANIRFPDPPFQNIRWGEGVWVRRTVRTSMLAGKHPVSR